MTKQQVDYLILYESGSSVEEIARLKHKSKSTVSRVLKRAKGKKCPFSADCNNCPLDDCAISEKYAVLLNGQIGKNSRKFSISCTKMYN